MRIASVILIIGLVCGLVFQHLQQRRLKAQNQQLATQIENLNARIAAQDAAVQRGEQKIEQDQTELLRLRNQAAQLRAATNELNDLRLKHEQLAAENQRMRAGQAIAPGTASGQAGADPFLFVRDSWKFAGFATPESTLESVVFAMSQGDHRAMLSAVTPEEAARMSREFEGKSDEQISRDTRRQLSKISSYRILERKELSPDEVVLDVYASGGEDKVIGMLMKRVGAEWRFAGPLTDKR
ncbi:MAG: hypothetical protein L0Y58_20215 [Verrucomicrobia subdivision 3 bacterium]|nr:hypothetical protein [Limisphaerales bacterium]